MGNIPNAANRLFWVNITVYHDQYPTSGVKACYSWRGPWHVRSKWSWYFKYRAALYQVQNPRSRVDFTWGQTEPDTRTRIDFVKQSITAKKRMVSKLSSELQKHKDYLLGNDIFGLDGDDGRITKAENKLAKYQSELAQLHEELEKLTDDKKELTI